MALISRVSRKKPESYVCRLLEKALSVRNWFGLHDLIGFDARAKLRTEEEVKRKGGVAKRVCCLRMGATMGVW